MAERQVGRGRLAGQREPEPGISAADTEGPPEDWTESAKAGAAASSSASRCSAASSVMMRAGRVPSRAVSACVAGAGVGSSTWPPAVDAGVGSSTWPPAVDAGVGSSTWPPAVDGMAGSARSPWARRPGPRRASADRGGA